MEASFDAIAIALTSARDCAGCERETALMLAADWEAELLRREAAWENRYGSRLQFFMKSIVGNFSAAEQIIIFL